MASPVPSAGDGHCPAPAGHTSAGTSQAALGLLGHLGTGRLMFSRCRLDSASEKGFRATQFVSFATGDRSRPALMHRQHDHLFAAQQKPQKRPTRTSGLKESTEAEDSAENCRTAPQAINTVPKRREQTPCPPGLPSVSLTQILQQPADTASLSQAAKRPPTSTSFLVSPH